MNYVDVFDQLANVAMIARKCPTPVLRTAYIKVMRDWCAQTQWLRVTIPGVTVADTAVYSLGSDTHLEIIGVFAVSASRTIQNKPQVWPVTVSDSGSWNPNLGSAQPRRYAYVPEGQIALNPTPDDVYDVTATAIVQPKEGVTQIPEAPLLKYSTVFELGALAELLDMKDTPWHNPTKAAKSKIEYQAGIGNGKAEVQRNFNTGAQRVRPRPFFV